MPAATDADAAEEMLGDGGRRSILDAGPTPGSQPSTIVDVTGPGRPGAAAGRDLARAAQRDRRAARRRDPRRGLRPSRCASTSPSSSSPRSSPTCSAWWPARSRCAPGRSPRSATATCTRCRSRTSAASRCSAGSGRRSSSRASCRSSSLSEDPIFHDAAIVLVGGALICLLGVARRPLRARRAHQARGAGAGRGLPGAQPGAATTPSSSPAAGQFSLDPTQAALLSVVVVVATVNAVNFVDGLDGLAAGVVGDRRGGVLRVRLQARRRQRRDARDHRRAALRRPRRRLRGLPAAQLLPGPDLHGRLRARC